MNRAGNLSIEFWDYHRLGRASKRISEINDGITRLSPSEPTCSIVAPAYNEAENIVGTLLSISRNKTTRSTEVIIVDNGSTDSTADIAYESGARVVVCNHKGIGAARQRGLLEARGEIILTTDVDTLVGPEWIEAYCSIFKQKTEIAAISGGFVYLDERGPNVKLQMYLRAATIVHGIKNLSQSTLIVPGFNFAARRGSMMAVDGYDETLKGGEDVDIARKLAKNGRVLLSKDSRLIVATSGRRIIENGIFSHGMRRFRSNLFDQTSGTEYVDVR